MLTLLDKDGATVHLCHHYTHFTLCGVYRLNIMNNKEFKRVKRSPNCIQCAVIHGAA